MSDGIGQLNELETKALARLKALISIGMNAGDYGEEGPWSEADFDELISLSNYLRHVLPENYFSIIGEYPYYDNKQRRIAERLDRAIQFQNTYGRIHVVAEIQELEPTFELTENERERVVKLTGQIRKIVFASTVFDEPHKKRLLNRIAAIEAELHQPNGRLDVILGGVSDFGDTLKKFGGDLKPLVDRISEIKKITQSKSKEYSQIPPPDEVEALPPPEDE